MLETLEVIPQMKLLAYRVFLIRRWASTHYKQVFVPELIHFTIAWKRYALSACYQWLRWCR